MMSRKQKTKRYWGDTVATEFSPGWWQFSIDGILFRWQGGVAYSNLLVKLGEGCDAVQLVHMARLHDAVIFAHGWCAAYSLTADSTG